MGKHDWYRSRDWNDEIDADFRAKLSRSRSSRAQYLQIQASMLTERYPTVSLKLIDEYFETGDSLFVPAAHEVRARAYRSLGEIKDAVQAYKAALSWEQRHPHFVTDARIDLPRLVSEAGLTEEYDYAWDILNSRFSTTDHAYPSVRYQWNGVCALIAQAQGEAELAREFAERALRASQAPSPFLRHQDVGLVQTTSDDFGRRITAIANQT